MAIAPDFIPASRQLNLLWERIQALLTKRWVPTVVNLGALLLLITALVSWAWSTFKPPAPQTPVVQASRAERLNLQPLLDAHLFGRAARGPGGSLESVPISSLNLVLVGVVAAVGGGYAMISVDGRAQESYAVGQEIIGGAILQSVLADRILIQRGGSTESLMLQDAVKPLEGVSTYVSPVSQHQPAIQQQGEKQFQVTREEVNKQMRSPDFLSQARLIPNPGGGFLVREIKTGSVYEKLGLRMGDVIRMVNGVPVNNAEDAMKFYQQLAELKDVQLEVMRAGQVEQLQYKLH
ncbi:MAG: hypothetical protein A2150_01735 [Candidatus Muproteobacteria bacterium RBG_16_64_11]|uniref:PDZ domain-containing protein n=1 Tax=Candidatus Muproteobacteria bacterium RBG_16_64_11 TaxID=1817758 RepID=A0A1F6TIK6_9PROT|nr:MAG: hypothetical protein A2150_01735 [Candidatus Muproteobacteria bacterium RBG_16_64_11]